MGRDRVRRAAGALIAALGLGCTDAPAPIAGGPSDAPTRATASVPAAGAALDPWAACARCHVSTADEHARSLHALAASDPLYLREVALVPDRTFCDGCHGAANDPPGIGCAGCHVRDGAIVGTVASDRAPHAVLADPLFASDAACGSCHQFDFPHRPGDRMQRTLDEAESLGEDRASCVSCHFSRGHDVRISDEELTSAVRVSVTTQREGERVRVRFVVRAGAVGHAVPTGDVYRNLELRAWIARAPRSLRTAVLSREMRPAADGLHELRDRRVPAPGHGARVVELSLQGDGPAVRWQLEWLALPRASGERSTIPDAWWRRPIASGTAPVSD